MSRTVHRFSSAVVALVVLGLAGSDAAAQGGDKVAAEALFQEGRRLLDEGKLAEACPKLAASQAIDPAVGTLLYLGDCYERSGKTATAWATFHSAASAAAAAGQAPRQKIALDKAAALEPKLSRLTIVVPEASRVDGLQVKRDGQVVDKAIWGTSVPVDPGQHEIIVSAPGRRQWKKAVSVAGDAAKESVEVPALEQDPTRPGVQEPVAPPVVSPAKAEEPPARDTVPSEKWGTQRLIGVSAAGLGVVGLAVGTVFGLKMKSKQDEAKDNCLDYPTGCNATGLAANDDAKSAGGIATVGFIAGGVLIVGGAALFFTAPSSKPATKAGAWTIAPMAGRGEGGLMMRGAW